MKKALILLGLRNQDTRSDVARRLYAQASWVNHHPGGTVRLVVRDERAHEVAPVLDVPELDLGLELGLRDDASYSLLVDQLSASVNEIRDDIDAERSIAIVGQEHVLVTGDGPFQLYRCFGKLADISLEQFKDHFLNIHSQFGTDLPGRLPYRQLHRDEDATERLRTETGFTHQPIDGVAQLLFYGPEAFAGLGGDPVRAKAASDDGGLFIDADTRRATIASVVLTGGPID